MRVGSKPAPLIVCGGSTSSMTGLKDIGIARSKVGKSEKEVGVRVFAA
jgi:hypothetical protein